MKLPVDTSTLTPVSHHVTQADRAHYMGAQGAVIWFTGLSASGKSSLAMALEAHMLRSGYACYTLDGDNVRRGLNANLGFSEDDRTENIRRVSEVAALFADAGIICITAFISPYREGRARARAAASNTSFHEIYIAADLATCEIRDPKGLYRKARAREILDFTGIDSPYQHPLNPDLVIDTANQTFEQSLSQLVDYVAEHIPAKTDR
ncbi:adenylyl-sulfate kinase [Pseudomonas sp. PB105]|uniref:adenylyl-sulfate kinase n=1 Tax=unclassified Pseudomonas TaxID=196821 RepID=UPI000C144B1B|nr:MULTISPECIES: adenylyl-sulfate kinase [unclassified Pseudomonas]KAE9653863.1 adenylyl-sulfate kinase [Pseudomonas sp. PB105]MVW96788.1 adenylyl-sulfate kinase [Pseudomonas sp. PB100]PIB62190.1 adenylylsulfate kinase [Pseudomonas sp. 2822-17]